MNKLFILVMIVFAFNTTTVLANKKNFDLLYPKDLYKLIEQFNSTLSQTKFKDLVREFGKEKKYGPKGITLYLEIFGYVDFSKDKLLKNKKEIKLATDYTLALMFISGDINESIFSDIQRTILDRAKIDKEKAKIYNELIQELFKQASLYQNSDIPKNPKKTALIRYLSEKLNTSGKNIEEQELQLANSLLTLKNNFSSDKNSVKEILGPDEDQNKLLLLSRVFQLMVNSLT